MKVLSSPSLAGRIEKYPRLWRWILAGPMGFVLSVLTMATLPLVLPSGAGGINHILMPVLFFPLIWAGYILWPLVADRIARCAAWYFALLLISLIVLLLNFI